MKVVHTAKFELSVDGVPRSYRDRKNLALQGAQILKSRNPNRLVRLKDLQTGEEIVIAFKSGQQSRYGPKAPSDRARLGDDRSTRTGLTTRLLRRVNSLFSLPAGRTRVRK